ncbi:MAG: dioxygenase [Friedmanniella sp.]
MSSLFERGVPAGAYDAFLPEAAAASRAHKPWQPEDGPMPSLFLSHGAPPLLDDADWMRRLLAWSLSMPKPRSILIVSAHWESAPLSLSSSVAAAPLVYDFGGFAPRYYSLTYPTPDASALAARVQAVMADTTSVHEHGSRGLDHGAWVPLMVMYPLADVPVLQLSLPTEDPGDLLALGRRLRTLREEGVLVIGSGFTTHGLPFLNRRNMMGEVPSWSSDFDAWTAELLASGDVDALAGFRDHAPGMPYCHPTVEHFIPMFVTFGAASAEPQSAHTTIDGYMMGLSRRSFQLH